MGRREQTASKSSIFRERLRASRLRAGLTQAGLSDAAGISGVTLSKLEQGVNAPTLDILLALCRTLNVSPNFLVGWGSESLDEPDATRRSLILRLEAAVTQLPDDWLKVLSDIAEQVLVTGHEPRDRS